MSSPSLAPPPAPPAPPPPPRLPVRAPLRRERAPRPTGRPTRGSLALSLVAHAVVLGGLWIAHPLVRPVSPPPARPAADANSDGEQVSYLDFAEFPEGIPAPDPGAAPLTDPRTGGPVAPRADTATAAAPPISAFPTRIPTRLPPAPVVTGGGGGAPSLAPGAGGTTGPQAPASGAAALGRRGYGDRRLDVRPEAVPERPISREEAYRRHFLQRLEQIQDSTIDEMEHQRRLRNWTWRDKEGREWGIAEGGQPVIAGRRIPLPPIQLGERDRDQEDGAREEARQRGEIQRQAEDVSRDRHLRERQRVIRQRADSIRAARKAEEEKAREGQSTP